MESKRQSRGAKRLASLARCRDVLTANDGKTNRLGLCLGVHAVTRPWLRRRGCVFRRTTQPGLRSPGARRCN